MIIQWIEGYPIVSDKPILYLLFTRVYPCFKVDEGLPEIGTRCFWMWRMWMPGAVSSWGSFLKKLSHTLRLLNSLLWKMVRWFMMIYDYLWWFMMIYDDLDMIWLWKMNMVYRNPQFPDWASPNPEISACWPRLGDSLEPIPRDKRPGRAFKTR